MNRVPLTLRTVTGLLASAALMAAAPARGPRPTADVTGVSITSSANRAELVIDVRGVVDVSDFTLSNPSRLVVDLVGARLVAPVMLYDGVNRAGIRNVRYAQFRPDVVRVVVELDSARDYDVKQEDAAIRVGFLTSGSFTGWSTSGGAAPAVALSVPASEVLTASTPAPAVVIPVAAPVAPLPSAIVRGPIRSLEAFQNQASQQPPISITFDNATIQEVVASFAAFTQRSIVLGSQIQGNVTAEIRNQPWDLAFNAVLQSHGLMAIELPGGIIRVDSRAALASQDSLEPITTRVVPIDYARAVSLAPSVAGVVSSRGKVNADSVTNSIIVTEINTRLDGVVNFIKSLDQRTPQVAIQSRIVFVDRTELENLGLRYDLGTSTQFFNQLVQRPDPANPGQSFDPEQTVVNLGGNAVAAIANATAAFPEGAPALNLVYSTVIGDFALTAFLEALQQVTLADLQAEPAVTVADNRDAYIFSGERTPIRQVDVGAITGGAAAPRATTTFQETGIRLRVTPHVVAGTREVLMTIKAERSNVTPSAISEIGAIFQTQEAQTQLLVRDGETAVIGGLTVTEIDVTKSGIPFLVDLPVIGPLFGFRSNKESRRDLLILVTPHIVDDLSTAGTSGTNH
jgi:type IV pilus assembly protein PilQ